MWFPGCPLRCRRVSGAIAMRSVLLGLVVLGGLSASPGAVWGGAAADGGGSAAAAPAADTLLAARDTLAAAVAVRQRTQREREAWHSRRDSLVAAYRRLTATLARRRAERERLERGVAVVSRQLDDLARREREARRLRATLDDTLAALLADLRAAVAADLPFLPGERRARLETVADRLADPTVPAADRLRSLLEALQVEAAYGTAVEVGLARITLAGREQQVQLLRLGRVALLWLTPDGSRCGRYDPATAAWVELSSRWRRPIADALEMAAHHRPLALVTLPLGKVAP